MVLTLDFLLLLGKSKGTSVSENEIGNEDFKARGEPH
jgi:hypothetical protein